MSAQSQSFEPYPPTLSDNLMESFNDASIDADERLSGVRVFGGTMGNVIADGGWMENPYVTSPVVHNMMAYAAIPFLENIIVGEPQSIATAYKVSANVKKHSATILEGDFSNPRELITRVDGGYNLGSIAEFAMYGLAAWSITNGLYVPESHVLPATSDQDKGRIRNDKFDAYDIGLYESGELLRKIQIKAGLMMTQEDYVPEISVISPQQVFDGDARTAPLSLLEALVDDDAIKLRRAAQASKRIVRLTAKKQEDAEIRRAARRRKRQLRRQRQIFSHPQRIETDAA